MGGNHQSHASGIAQRRGKRNTGVGSRASQWKSNSGFAIANLNLISKVDINTYTKSAAPTQEELVKKLLGL